MQRLKDRTKQTGFVIPAVIETHAKRNIIRTVKDQLKLMPELRAGHIITSDDEYIIYR